MLRKFFKKNIEAAEIKGDIYQQKNIEHLVAVVAHCQGELGDMMGGRRKSHHNPKDLADQSIAGIEGIVRIRREIEG